MKLYAGETVWRRCRNGRRKTLRWAGEGVVLDWVGVAWLVGQAERFTDPPTLEYVVNSAGQVLLPSSSPLPSTVPLDSDAPGNSSMTIRWSTTPGRYWVRKPRDFGCCSGTSYYLPGGAIWVAMQVLPSVKSPARDRVTEKSPDRWWRHPLFGKMILR